MPTDKQRLDWLNKDGVGFWDGFTKSKCTQWHINTKTGETLRQAIDSAIDSARRAERKK